MDDAKILFDILNYDASGVIGLSAVRALALAVAIHCISRYSS